MTSAFDSPKTDFADLGDPELVRDQVNRPQSVASGPSFERPDMTIIERDVAPPPDLDLKAFGPWANWISDAANAKSAPADYLAMSMLSIVAALIGATRWISPWKSWAEPAVIWAMLIGRPSAGKSPAMDAVRSGFIEIERGFAANFDEQQRQFEADCVKAKAYNDLWEGQLKEAVSGGKQAPIKPREAEKPDAPALQRISISDATVEASASVIAGNPRGVLLLRDELAGFLGNLGKYGEGDRPYWMEAYGGRQYTVDRKKLPNPLVLHHLAVSILGGIQPDRLGSLLLGNHDDDGFVARFLYAWPEPAPPLRPNTPIDEPAWARACHRMRQLDFITNDDDELKPVILPVEEAALEEFQAWREHNHEESNSVSSFEASAWGKMPGHVLRLALVLEHLWWSSGDDDTQPQTVSRAALGAAIDLVEQYFKPMLKRTFGSASQPPAERDAATLGRALKTRKPRPLTVNAREIQRKWRLPGLNSPGRTDAAIQVLEEACWLSPVEQSSGKAGRPRKDYQVNPAIYQDEQ
jgi:Protein of unknown function (DUF3987)